jgi:hypothetical protein
MNLKISDVALDLGVFALDHEIDNSPILDPFGSPAWHNSAAWDRSRAEFFASAS